MLKDAGWIGDPDMPFGDRRNMAWAGSTVVRGRAEGVVVATGTATAVGGLAAAMSATEGGKAPLIARMESFARVIAVVVLVAAVAIGAAGVLLRGESVATMFLFAVALAVSAIPEGLPVALTVTLAIAARRMAGRGAIVRSLPAVEGLGSCTLIASDKTGTLTCNELTVREIRLPDGRVFEVTGAATRRSVTSSCDGAGVGAGDDAGLRRVLEIAAVCNEADLVSLDDHWVTRGDPTDIALLALAGKGGVNREALQLDWPVTPRSRSSPSIATRRPSTTRRRDLGRVKGAPEQVMPMCRLTAGRRARAHGGRRGDGVARPARAGARFRLVAGPAARRGGGVAAGRPGVRRLRGTDGPAASRRPRGGAALPRRRASGSSW